MTPVSYCERDKQRVRTKPEVREGSSQVFLFPAGVKLINTLVLSQADEQVKVISEYVKLTKTGVARLTGVMTATQSVESVVSLSETALEAAMMLNAIKILESFIVCNALLEQSVEGGYDSVRRCRLISLYPSSGK